MSRKNRHDARMPTIFTSLPGQNIASLAAAKMLATVPPFDLPTALMIVPTRRGCTLMRRAFLALNPTGSMLLPRMVALADIESELPQIISNPAGLAELATIPPAMPEWQRISLLTKQVMAFERQRKSDALLEHALLLAKDLAQLQDQFALHGIPLTPERLQQLSLGNDAAHWQAPIEFLSIISRHWPAIEEACGFTISATRQTRIQQWLTDYWRACPPTITVMVIGSTASLEPTAALMQVIADAPRGSVVLPGLDTSLPDAQWHAVAEGHPYFHLKQFLARWPVDLAHVIPLFAAEKSIWLTALAPTAQLDHWRSEPPPNPSIIARLNHIACDTDEEEVRVAALIIREGAEHVGKRIALVTPDEGFMARVAAHLLRFNIIADRLSQGSLATTSTGSLWLALAAAIDEPSRMMAHMAVLRHPLVMQLSGWREWLVDAERYFRGLVKQQVGMLPAMPEALQMHEHYAIAAKTIRLIAHLSRANLLVSEWMVEMRLILDHLQVAEGEGHAAVTEALDALAAADELGRMRIEPFLVLLREALSKPWRGAMAATTPDIVMLTPIEARLQQFDRIIIARFTDDRWPGVQQAGPWLNFNHQQQLGLPKPEESISLMAHDILMLASGAEVFLTHARRDAGSPVARSRFLERLLTLLAVHNIPESALAAEQYRDWARALDKAHAYVPEHPAMPTPTATERAQEMGVSALEYLFTDPYRIYASAILKLKEVEDFDLLPEARDFGTIAHRAIEKLSEHWSEHARLATDDELAALTDEALRAFSDQPNIMLFWRRRLQRALAFVNHEEAERRVNLRAVTNEKDIKQSLTFGDHALTLRGRIDRLEEHADGSLTIGDYKTGAAATANDVLNGKAVQLLAYALLLQTDASIDYWGLPSGKREGSISAVDAATIADHQVLEKLRDALADFMDPATPLLAKPNGYAERFQNPYDGLSRYDEWAE